MLRMDKDDEIPTNPVLAKFIRHKSGIPSLQLIKHTVKYIYTNNTSIFNLDS
jgi:hypothetical protein